MNKTYNVIWEEKHSINIVASNEEEAIRKVLDCEYDNAEVDTEISASPEAFLMEA